MGARFARVSNHLESHHMEAKFVQPPAGSESGWLSASNFSQKLGRCFNASLTPDELRCQDRPRVAVGIERKDEATISSVPKATSNAH